MIRRCTLKGSRITSVLFCTQKSKGTYETVSVPLKQFLHPEVIAAFGEGYYIKGLEFSVPYIARLRLTVLGVGRGVMLFIQGASDVQKINLFQLQHIIILIKYVKEIQKGQVNNFRTIFIEKLWTE